MCVCARAGWSLILFMDLAIGKRRERVREGQTERTDVCECICERDRESEGERERKDQSRLNGIKKKKNLTLFLRFGGGGKPPRYTPT